MSSLSDIYELRISLFDHGDPEEFLLFVHKFKIDFAATGTLGTEAKVQYLSTILRG